MRNALILALCGFASLCSAQPTGPLNQTDAQGRKQGTWSKPWPESGKPRYIGQFKDDKPTGLFYHYADDGTLTTEQVYAPDGRTSHATHYHPNGQVMARGKYVGQEKDSTWNYYTDEGHLTSVEHYASGKLQGEKIGYYEDGGIAEKTHYEKGVQHGEWRQYFQGGRPKAQANYVNGQPEGVMTWFYPGGKKEIEGKCVNGARDGVWTYFNEDGSVQIEVTYRMGEYVGDRKLNGVFKDYYDDDQLKEELTYKEGRRNGKFTEYYANGHWTLRDVPADVEHSYPAEQERVLEGQTKKREGMYKNDALDGDVKEYDEKGKLVKTTRYAAGAEMK